MEKFKDRWVRREGFSEWYDGGELIHLLYLLPIEQPRTWTSLEIAKNGNVILYSLLLTFLSDKTCHIVNITYEHPLKCLLIEENRK